MLINNGGNTSITMIYNDMHFTLYFLTSVDFFVDLYHIYSSSFGDKLTRNNYKF